MKKLITSALVIMMIAVLSVSIFAADSGLILAVDSYREELGNMSPQIKGGESTDRGCLGLGPIDYGDGEFGDAFMEFEFDVDTAGTYVISVCYAAKQGEGQIRCADMIVNGGDRIHLDIENTGDWAVYAVTTVTVELNAGTNVILLKNVEGFDNSTYKAINIDYLSWEPKAEEIPEETIETVDTEPETPEEPDVPEEPTAPQTGFAVAIIGAIACVSCGIAIKSRH